MPAPSPTGNLLLLIDDDVMSREVLMLLATAEGFMVVAQDSGQAALDHLAIAHAFCPDIVLVDMQMPGLAGDALARQLRQSCGESSVLLAMSGSEVPPSGRANFDCFLLKPFSMEDLHAAIRQSRESLQALSTPQPSPITEHVVALNPAVFASLSEGMPMERLMELYSMCLDDAERRLETMRKASAIRDSAAFLSGAHAIKGGCGMVGATELAAMAASMESIGLPPVGDQAPFDDFASAAHRLRRMLDALTKLSSHRS